MQLAGRVWEDVPLKPEDKNNPVDSVPNGRIDADVEEGVDGVEVFVYDESGNLATIYDGIDNGIVKQPIITSDGGYWNAQRIVIRI